MTVKEIVATWLKEHGYEGLCNNSCGECGCGVDYLMPCDGIVPDCAAAYKRKLPCRECGIECRTPIGETVYCENETKEQLGND